MDSINNLEQNTEVLEVTENSKKYLKTTASWTTFMAVLGFIGIAFLVLCGIMVMLTGNLVANVSYQPMPFHGFFSVIGVFYIAIAVIAFFPALFLLRFSQQMNKALLSQDTLVLEDAFKNMKAYWKFTGIYTIVMIALCIIAIVVMAIAIATLPLPLFL